MVEKLYYTDPYLKDFEASVISVKGDKVVLDRTAFYPGGGGQANDLGTIEGKPVVDVLKEGDDILHVVPGHSFSIGQKVKCAIDWNRRFELMCGHSGQHILFRSMQEQNPDLGVSKVDISIEKKVLLFNGEMPWDKLKKAVVRANEIIDSDLKVEIQESKKGSPELDEVRIKADRIAGDSVRVVRIGTFDAAACGGVHVRRTGEIGGISIVKMVSGRQSSDWSIQFEVGPKAARSTSDLSITTLAVADLLGCAIDNVEPTVSNLKRESTELKEKLKSLSRAQLESLEAEKIDGFLLYAALLSNADRKTMNDIASRLIRAEGAIVLLVDVSDNAFMIVACNEKVSLDCPAMLKKGLDMLKGRGGGKKNYAQGGGADVVNSQSAFEAVRHSVIDIISPESGSAP